MNIPTYTIMQRYTIILLAVFSLTTFNSCEAQFKLPTIGDVLGDKEALTETDVINGLKEALSVGTNKSTDLASKVDGYYKNPAIFIPFPPEAEEMEKRLRAIGFDKPVDDFIMTLNRAAEEAAKEAAPIFLDAVKGMSIQDAWGILKGGDYAATDYLQDKTTAALTQKFQPVVSDAIETVHLTSFWEPLVDKYNKIPFVKKVNPDLEAYTTELAIQGLFHLISIEEEKIRKNPGARVTDLLKRVFAEQD